MAQSRSDTATKSARTRRITSPTGAIHEAARGNPAAFIHNDGDPPCPESRLVRSARPAFLYVMYVLILCALPVGLVAAFDAARAEAIARAMGGYFSALPDALYALFGTGYLGYTAARQWGKAKGVEA